MIPKWVETISNLKMHIYRKRVSFNKQKDELKTGEAVIDIGYSKSYNSIQQDEIQSAYFGQQNFSIFTSCSYNCEAEQGDFAKIPVVVISESSDYSRIGAFTCTNTIVNELKKRMKDSLKKVILWSDGWSSHEWHYNEAHHGKGPMDCVAGTIKKVVFGLVKSNKITINTAEEFATEAQKLCCPSNQSTFPKMR